MPLQKLKIVYGIPGSGKTAFSRHLAKIGNLTLFDSDTIALNLNRTDLSDEDIFDVAASIFTSIVRSNCTISSLSYIFTDSLSSYRRMETILSLTKQNNMAVQLIRIDCSPITAHRRVELRNEPTVVTDSYDSIINKKNIIDNLESRFGISSHKNNITIKNDQHISNLLQQAEDIANKLKSNQ